MASIIKNTSALATNLLRGDALTIAEAGLAAIDTETVLMQSLSINNSTLTIAEKTFDLDDYKNIYVIGFGKVSCTAARTLESILKQRVQGGAVVGVGQVTCEIVDTYIGTHPFPSHINYSATKHIEEIAHHAKEDDLVIVVISGGGSALLCSSMGECDQGMKLYEAFLQSGGTIDELNVVRKHISHLKGGGLAAALYPATVIGLVFSDVIGGDPAAVASGPTYFDVSTKEDAQGIIDRYNLGTYKLRETPKETKYFEKVHNFELVSNTRALQAMCETASSLGYTPVCISATSYQTPEQIQLLLTEHAGPGSFYCLGGETKVSVPEGCTGKGGRNDYLALAVQETLRPSQVFVSLATDGHDNSQAAGAIVDAQSKEKSQARGLQSAEYLHAHNSYPYFEAIGDHIETGMLESNVADLTFWLNEKTVVIEKSAASSKHPITAISAKEIKDSRGKPTIEVTVEAGGYSGSFAVPSGASTGTREVAALPVEQALRQIQRIVAPALLGMSVTNQAAIDAKLHEIDGTHQLSLIGGNTALGVSVATLRAAAAAEGVELWQKIAHIFDTTPQAHAPRLFVNLINGGQHAPFGSVIQEHQIIPETTDVHEAFRAAERTMLELEKILHRDVTKPGMAQGDEGGWAIQTKDTFAPFHFLQEAIEAAQSPCTVSLGADIAASSFFDTHTGMYTLNSEVHTPANLQVWYKSLHTQFPTLGYVEDPFSEDDMSSFALYQKIHKGVVVIGDDLTTTNEKILQKAIKHKALSGIIIKPNQIGTVTDTLMTMRTAYAHNIRCIVSHRSGETMDDFIADLAYGTKCFGLKAGAPRAPERRVKYDRLLTISAL